MKKYTLLLLIIVLIKTTVLSQGCLPNGITFTTQEEIDNFQNDYPGCTEIEGGVWVSGNDITNLNGLNSITTIGEYLIFSDNIALTSLAGLNNLSTIGEYLIIAYNNELIDLTGLNNLIEINEYLEIAGNSSLTNLSGLDNLTTIEGYFRISENNLLTSFTGLESLTTIGEELNIYRNLALINLVGLSNLTSIGDRLFIGCENDDISALTTLTGLYNLTTIGWDVTILSNSSLIDLEGLNNLTSIGGSLTIDNNIVLSSIEGITNIDAASIINNLGIRNNPSLSSCEVNSVCDYLANPNGYISIFFNAPGCNSKEEIEEACFVSVDSYDKIPVFTIYPNPAKDKLFLSGENTETINKVTIYNQLGQKVLNENRITSSIDISMLRSGMYIIEIDSDIIMIREKFIVE